MTTPVFDRRKDPSLNVATIGRRLKQTIYLSFLGAPSLDELAKMSEDSGQWSEFKALLTDRSNNVGVIAALVVTSSAVYVAANPPTDLSKWLPQFPYVCMLASYGAGMLSIVFSFAQVVFLSFMGPGDIDAARTSTAYRMALFTLLMSPLALLLLAALFAGVGFTGALWLGSILWMKSYCITTASDTRHRMVRGRRTESGFLSGDEHHEPITHIDGTVARNQELSLVRIRGDIRCDGLVFCLSYMDEEPKAGGKEI
ncbi:hypothetical protein EDC04DRAFT_2959213 [Pisolithus marmoratus]|nr:hypothetical protein EDC04DRAFT_2959213 [Pisolithus marmoratus]